MAPMEPPTNRLLHNPVRLMLNKINLRWPIPGARIWTLRFVLPLLCSGTFADTGRAEILWTGNVSPSSPSEWTIYSRAVVGDTMDGSVTVTNGSVLESTDGVLGAEVDATGEVTITGPYSQWFNQSGLRIGQAGNGRLTVENGARVTTQLLFASPEDLYGNGEIYALRGGVLDADMVFDGTAGPQQVISFGSGGILTMNVGSQHLGVGYRREGSLVVTDGHELRSSGGVLGERPGSVGVATVTGVGSSWDFTANSLLYVGHSGSGSLTVEEGGQVSTTTAYLGYADGSSGVATVTGNGSQLNLTSELNVGYNGSGMLVVEAGGQVASQFGHIGGSTGYGELTVTGIGSLWTVDALNVGRRGAGTLEVSDGGKVEAVSIWASLSDLKGDGSINAQGAVLDEDLVFNATNGQQLEFLFGSGGTLTVNADDGTLGAGYKGRGSLTIADGVEVTSASGCLGCLEGAQGEGTVTGSRSRWTLKSSLRVGYHGSGTLLIDGGGEVSSASSSVGYATGTTGSATVTGEGSEWEVRGTLTVGQGGEGALTVTDGGSVTAQTLFASLGDLHGDGTIIVSKGAVLDADLVLNEINRSHQNLPFGSGGVLSVTFNGGSLGAGYKGTGTLTVSGGTAIESYVGYLGFSATATGDARVQGSGSQWKNSSRLYVGHEGAGSLTIEEGGHVSNTEGYIGGTANSTGAVAVTGLGSQWDNSSDLYVGHYGDGTLTIEAGGQVTSRAGFLGAYVGATGSAVVAGAGSSWSNSSSLYVGGYQARFPEESLVGSLAVQAGGSVTSVSGHIGTTLGSIGTAVVTGDGSVWDISSDLTVGGYGNGALEVRDGGRVSNRVAYVAFSDGSEGTASVVGEGSRWEVDSLLSIASNGRGTLTVEAGGVVTSQRAAVSGNPANPGLATVTGVGSRWDTASELAIGWANDAALYVQAGGKVTSDVGTLGRYQGGTGVAVVSGAGSELVSSSDLYVGREGRGMLTVDDGGVVTAGTLWASLSDLHGDGTIEVLRGAVLDADFLFDASSGTQSLLPFGTGGTVTVTHDGGDLGVGYRGAGSLTVVDGVEVSSERGYVGYHAGASGEAVVAGLNSRWTNGSDLYVGRGGGGSLAAISGGQVSSRNGYLGHLSGGEGQATISGSGSQWASTDSLSVGSSGVGELIVTEGGSVVSKTGIIGRNADSTGEATISGRGSQWHGVSEFFIGNYGNGTLTVNAGGQVVSSVGYLGYQTGGTGAAIVSGVGSDWSNGGLHVGYEGSGTLRVDDGGVVNAKNGYIAYDWDSTGDVVVSGVGSELNSDFSLHVGFQGSGTLSVQAGGRAVSNNGYLGLRRGVSGVANITGAGSEWNNAADLFVGPDGGSLTVADGGVVTSGTLWASLSDLHGDGVITVSSGAVIDADLVFDAASSDAHMLPFGDGGMLALTLDGGELGVGFESEGNLAVADGVAINSSSGYLGYYKNAVGKATIAGEGSRWDIEDASRFGDSELCVGCEGSGTLRVSLGGGVSNGSGSIGDSAGSVGAVEVTGAGSEWVNRDHLYVGRYGTGALRIESGGIVESDGGSIASYSIGKGEAIVTGVGSQWNVDSSLVVGSSGTGVLTVEAGGLLASDRGCVGCSSNSSGVVAITGAGSQWAMESELTIGAGGVGVLRVRSGGAVSSGGGVVGDYRSGAGEVVVSGVGAQWSIGSTLQVGYEGQGVLNVEAGGLATSVHGYLGRDRTGVGHVSVAGDGSRWDNASSLYVGYEGEGTLSIAAGGQVTSGESVIGTGHGSVGRVAVTGSDSRWAVDSDLTVGSLGNGLLDISDGAIVSVAGMLTIVRQSSAVDSFVNIATGGALAIIGDTHESLDRFLENVSRPSAVRYWDSTIDDWASIAGGDLGVDFSLEYQAAGDLAGYTLLTVGSAPLLPGDYNDDGRVDGADYTVWRDALGGTVLPNDASPGSIDQNDYLVWRTHFGETSLSMGSDVATVPSPSSLFLVSVAVLGVLAVEDRKRQSQRQPPVLID